MWLKWKGKARQKGVAWWGALLLVCLSGSEHAGVAKGLDWVMLASQIPAGKPTSIPGILILMFFIFLMFVLTGGKPKPQEEEKLPEPELLERLLDEVPIDRVSPWGHTGGKLLKAKDGEVQAYISVWKLDERLTKKPPVKKTWWEKLWGI
jgi:hypothetical protein